MKYGYKDLRPALERPPLVKRMRVASARSEKFLAQFGILVGGYVASIGEAQTDFNEMPYSSASFVSRNPMYVARSIPLQEMRDEIEKNKFIAKIRWAAF